MKKRSYFKSELFLKVILILSLFVILVIGGFTYRYISNLITSQKLVVKTHDVNLQLKLVVSHLRDAEGAHKNYIVTKDSVYIDTYLLSKIKVNTAFKELNELIKLNDQQDKNLNAFQQMSDSLYGHFSKINRLVVLDSTNTEVFKTLYFKEKIIMDSIKQQANAMFNLENKLLNNYQKENELDLYFTPVFFYCILVITLLLIFVAYFKISNDLKIIKAKNDQLLIFKEASKQNEIIGKHGNWVWYADTNTFVYSNNLYRLLGEAPQSFEPTLANFLKFVHPDDLAKLNKSLKQMMATEVLPFVSFRVIKKNGDIAHLKAYGKSFYGPDGKKRLIGNTSDVSYEIENLLALEAHNLKLERNNKELTAFNYAASHDLQEPLRKVQTFISRLDEKETDKLSASGRQYLVGIKSAVTRMRHLIDDLILFSKSNKPHEALINTDLNKILENTKRDIAEILVEKQATLTSDKLPTIAVIPFQIQQLFLNLLTNALKYSKKDTAPHIEIHYEKVKSSDEPNLTQAVEGDYHKITFSDNGIGFDQKYAIKIFELFNRLHNKQDYSGTGIGLSICKKIVENHKGYIFAKGKVNKGAVFFIYLPTA